MKLITSLLATILFISSASAQEPVTPDHKVLLERLFTATKAKESYEMALTAGMKAGLAGAAGNLPPEMQGKMQRAMKKVEALMSEKMGWDVMRDDMVAAYSTKFSKADLEKLLPILEKPEVAAYFEKTTNLIPELTEISSRKAAAFQPEIEALMMEELMSPEAPGL